MFARYPLFLLLILSTFLFGCNPTNLDRGGVEIITTPSNVKVYLDGKDAGSTPYKSNNLLPGKHQIRLVSPDESETYQSEVEVLRRSTTVLNWQFASGEYSAGGYTLSLEPTGDKRSSLIVNSSPNQATLILDKEVKGFTPIQLLDIGEGQKPLLLSFPGHQTIPIMVRSILGYRLILQATLPKTITSISTPSPSSNTSSIPSTTLTSAKIIIKSTETGWLRVRQQPSSASPEIARVNTGESLPLLGEQSGWYQTQTTGGITGWVKADYVEKSTTPIPTRP